MTVARVWHQGFLMWWAELWTPYTEKDPPRPPRPMDNPLRPLAVEGHQRRWIALALTRRGAIRKARRMRERYQQGVHPLSDRPLVEIIE